MSHPTDDVTPEVMRRAGTSTKERIERGKLQPTGIEQPGPHYIEPVSVVICTEQRAGAHKGEEVFALVTKGEEAVSGAARRWAEAAEVGRADRSVSHPMDAVIVNEKDVMAGLDGPRVVLLGRDVTRLVMAGAQLAVKSEVVERALGKLTPEERVALGFSAA